MVKICLDWLVLLDWTLNLRPSFARVSRTRHNEPMFVRMYVVGRSMIDVFGVWIFSFRLAFH
jgi:hypothetical protein